MNETIQHTIKQTLKEVLFKKKVPMQVIRNIWKYSTTSNISQNEIRNNIKIREMKVEIKKRELNAYDLLIISGISNNQLKNMIELFKTHRNVVLSIKEIYLNRMVRPVSLPIGPYVKVRHIVT